MKGQVRRSVSVSDNPLFTGLQLTPKRVALHLFFCGKPDVAVDQCHRRNLLFALLLALILPCSVFDHKCVLFLDEMPEFNRKTLEVLRQPLEEGKVTISRAMNSSTFPADFILVAAMNPCPCGYRSDPRRACSCTPPQIEKYLSKISGPLLDRIDLHVEVPAVPFTQLAEMPPGAPSSDFRAQVLEARVRQAKRFGQKGPLVNGRMTPRQLRKLCQLKPEAMSILKAAMEELGLSARAHDKVLRVARTIADLEASEEIKPQHIAEAVGYRSLDRSVWM